MRSGITEVIRKMVRGSGKPAKALAEELLGSYDANAHYHRAIRSQKPLERVAELREQVIWQVQKDFAAYRQEIVAPQP